MFMNRCDQNRLENYWISSSTIFLQPPFLFKTNQIISRYGIKLFPRQLHLYIILHQHETFIINSSNLSTVN